MAYHSPNFFTAHAGEPPASNYATLDSRNNHPVIDHDDTTDESMYFTGFLGNDYAGNGLTALIGWMASTATSGNVVWNLAIERNEDEGTDLDSDSFASAQAATAAAPSTSGALQYTSIAFTSGAQMDSVVAGESFRAKLTRNASNGSDTMSGDAEVKFLAIYETP